MAEVYAYEHNGETIDRAAFYAIACDPRRSVAVEACAGAGKTWMLVSRILRALLDGAQPHEVLAITFTKKAAGEVRQRLQAWLQQFAHATPEQLADELGIRGVAPASAAQLAPALAALYATVLATGRPVQVRTFHSWFAALLRSAPLAVLEQLGLPAHHQLIEDDMEAVQAVWPRFQAAVANDAAAKADYFAAVAVHGRFQTHRALLAALAKRVELLLADAQGVVEASVQPFGAVFTEWAGLDDPRDALRSDDHTPVWSQFWAAARALGCASAKTFAEKGRELEQALTACDTVAALAALLTQQGGPRKFSDKLDGIDAIRAAQDTAVRLSAAIDQHSAWLHQQRMARLARRLIGEFAELKRERGWVDMNDLERAALHMLRDASLSGWVQERLDARVKHLLIDEFQDTNPLQWQALKAWLSAYAGAGSDALSVFVVGDPKQSIYRFRRAEPQVFRAAQAFVREGLGGDLLSCDHTHRNAPAVMAVVNGVMGAAQEAGEFSGFRRHTTESQAAGCVARLPQIERAPARSGSAPADGADPAWRNSLTTPRELPEDTLRSRECRQLAHWIAAELAAGRAPQDIMVLARKREPLGVLRDELRALHIPAQQPEKNSLADAPEVQDLLALLDALVSPTHDLSLAQALKSPLFGLGDEALVQLALRQREARAQGREVGWRALLLEAPMWDDGPASPPGHRPRDVGATLARWQSWVDTLPPHDALDAICHDGDVLARYAAAAPAALRASVLANLRALLGAALQLDGGRFLTPYALVRALRTGHAKAPALASANAVRLLTVHGAKGLEAPCVVLLDADAPPPAADTMGVLVDWPGEAAAPVRFTFLASEKHPPVCNQAALQTEHAARQREELNTLYVALTRARSTLVLSSGQPHRAAPHSWWQRLGAWADAHPGACHELPVPSAPEAPSAGPDGTLTPFFMSNLPQASVKTRDSAIKKIVNGGAETYTSPETEVADVDGGTDVLARLGQAMHRLLEWGPPVAGEAQRAWLAREFMLSPAQVQQAADMAQRIHTGEGAWAWQPEQVDWQGNEVELHHNGQQLRLDRLVRRRDTGVWWVLDFKTAHQPERQPDLLAQMRRYLAAMRAAHPGEPVQAAWLTGDGRLVVVPV